MVTLRWGYSSDHLPVSQLNTNGNMKTIGRGSQEMKNMGIINEKKLSITWVKNLIKSISTTFAVTQILKMLIIYFIIRKLKHIINAYL